MTRIGVKRHFGGTKVNIAQVPMDDDMEEVLIGSSGYTEQVFWHKFLEKNVV